jgi:multidrug resistance efflux pump
MKTYDFAMRFSRGWAVVNITRCLLAGGLISTLSSCGTLRDASQFTGDVAGGIASIVDEDLGEGVRLLVAGPADHLDELDRRREENQRTIAELDNQIGSAEARVDRLAEVVEALRERTESLVADIDTLNQDVSRLGTLYARQMVRKTELESERTQLVADIDRNERELRSLRLEHSIMAYVERERALGGEDPVDAQIRKLQSLSSQISTTPLP